MEVPRRSGGAAGPVRLRGRRTRRPPAVRPRPGPVGPGAQRAGRPRGRSGRGRPRAGGRSRSRRSARCTGWWRRWTSPTPAAGSPPGCWPGCGAPACCAAGWSRSWARAPGWPTTWRPAPATGPCWTRRATVRTGAPTGRRPASWNGRCCSPSAPIPTTRRGGSGWARAPPTPRRSGSPRSAWPTGGRSSPSPAATSATGCPPRTPPPSWPTSPPPCSPPGWPSPSPSSPPRAAACRLAVIGLGKCGGRELNYVSDVDVVFVAEPVDPTDAEGPALSSATRVAAALMRICHEAAWEVDAALRPEGKAGALVRTVAGHAAYYEQWASTWEFQALLKMRPVAGDPDLGRAYVDTLWPRVWTAGDRPGFVGRGAGDAPAGGGQHPARQGRTGAQARPRRAARRRVRRPAAADGARPGRRVAPARRHGAGTPGALGRRVRRPGGRRHADRLLPVPAHRRAPAPAAAAAPHPPAAHRRAAAALAGPLAGLQARRPGERGRRPAGRARAAHPRGAAAAREALLPAAALRGRPRARREPAARARRPPGTGCAPSGSPTRRVRCGT